MKSFADERNSRYPLTSKEDVSKSIEEFIEPFEYLVYDKYERMQIVKSLIEAAGIHRVPVPTRFLERFDIIGMKDDNLTKSISVATNLLKTITSN